MRIKMWRYAILAVLSMGWLVGCGNGKTTDPVEAKVGVQLATGTMLVNSPDRCPRAVEVTSHVREYLSDNPTASADNIMAEMDEAIKWEELTEQQRGSVQAILTAVEGELLRRTNNEIIPENNQVKALSIMDWIDETVAISCTPTDSTSPVEDDVPYLYEEPSTQDAMQDLQSDPASRLERGESESSIDTSESSSSDSSEPDTNTTSSIALQ